MKLLVVDDSSTMRRIIKNTLARLGHKDILEGADGLEGWAALDANPDVDMLITDWNMPEMSDEEYDDRITEDPDDQVEDDEMSPAEAAFQKGAEEASEGDKKGQD